MSPRHPERRHLRLLPEGQQPQAARQRHRDAEEDEEDGESRTRVYFTIEKFFGALYLATVFPCQ